MKNQYVNTTTLFNYFTAIASILLFTLSIQVQANDNQQMVFEGSLTDASGNPIDLSTADLTFYVTANGCYLYGESSSTSGDSTGNIIHRIGSGIQVTGSPNSFVQNLFVGDVSGTTTFAGNDCSVTAADTRLIQVSYPAEGINATMKIGTVPFARHATFLGGKSAADFVKATADTSILFLGGSAGQFLTKSVSGLTWTNSSLTAGQISSALGYTPASTTVTLTSINGSTSATQTFATNTNGFIAPTYSTSNGIHTLFFPMASSATTTAGLLSNADYTLFSNKLDSTAASIATVLGYVPANSATVLTAATALIKTNNLSDLTSATTARSNLGLGGLATKSSINLTTDVLGFLPVSNGGSQWTSVANGHYVTSNTAIGTSTVLANTKLFVESNSFSQVAFLKNTATNGYGLKIDVAGTSSMQYALNVNNASGSMFMVQNNGLVGIGTMNPASQLEISNPETAGALSSVLTVTRSSTGVSDTAVLVLQKSNGSQLSPASTNSGDQLGQIRFNGYTAGVFAGGASIDSFATGSPVGNNVPSALIFKTSPGTSVPIERLRITQGGQIGIGTQTPTSKFHIYDNTGGSELARFDGGNTGYHLTFAANTVEKGSIGVLQTGGSFTSNQIIPGAVGLRGVTAVQIGAGNHPTISVLSTNKVGVGTSEPTTALTVSGTISTTSGGYQYPDGTIQTTAAFSGYERVSASCISNSECFVSCSAGKKIISGGCSTSNATHDLVSSHPTSDTQYRCQWNSALSSNLVAYAICVKM